MKLAKLVILVGAAVISMSVAMQTKATGLDHDGESRAVSESTDQGSSNHPDKVSGTAKTAKAGSTEATYSSSESAPASSMPISEPSNMLMLALGFAGLIIGRYAARKKRRKL